MAIGAGWRAWSAGATIRAGIRRPRAVLVIVVSLALVAGLTGIGLALSGHSSSGPAATAGSPAPAAVQTTPPAPVCGNQGVLGGGPASAPAGSVAVPAGDDSGVDLGRPGTTYWFAPGTHTLGAGQYTQIIPGSGSSYVGAPGAVLDGEHVNLYAFGGSASGVRISYLTVKDFGTNGGNQNRGSRQS